MRTYLDCYPCLVRHAIEAARLTLADTGRQEELVQDVLRRLAAVTPPHTPVRLTAEIHELIRTFLGVSDPYARIKQKANQAALDMLPDLRRRCTGAPDRLQTAARLAIAGNIIEAVPTAMPSMSTVALEDTVVTCAAGPTAVVALLAEYIVPGVASKGPPLVSTPETARMIPAATGELPPNEKA